MAGNRGLGTLTLSLIAQIGGFVGPLDKAGRELDKRARGMERRMDAMGKAFGKSLIAGGALIAAGMTAAVAALDATIDRMDEMSKGAQKVGVTTEALSRLAYAADLSDVSMEQLQAGLAKLTKFQAEAAQGGEEAVKTFEAFGIAIKDSAGNLRGTEAVLQDFAEVFAKLPDGPEKTALALRTFGKSGAELIPLLNSGAKGLRDMAAEADHFGLTVDTVAGKQAEEFNDDLSRLEAQITGLANSITRPLLPELGKLAQALSDLNEADGDDFADLVVAGIGRVSKAVRSSIVEIEFWKKAWKEQGLFGEGILSVTERAHDEFARREALSESLDIHRGPLGRGTARKGALDGAGDAAAKRVADAARGLLATTQEDTQATRANSDAKRAAAEAARAQEDAVRDLLAAQSDLGGILENQARQLGGPALDAAYDYKAALVEIQHAEDELGKQGKLDADAQAQIALARDQATDAYQRQLDRIQAIKSPLEELIEQQERELETIGLTGPALQTANQLYGQTADEIARYGSAIEENNIRLEQAHQLMETANQVRDNFEDAFLSIIDGSKSASDAFGDFADNLEKMALKLFAKKAITWFLSLIFPGAGSVAGPVAGSVVDGLIDVFGGPRALGGPVEGSKLYEVGEGGRPELFASGGKTFLIPGQAGAVTPMSHLPSGGKELVNLPRGSSSEGAGGGVVVNVINNGDGSARTEQRMEGNTKIIDVIIEAAKSAVAKDIGRNGQVGKAIGSRFGVAPTGVVRG